MGGDFSDKLRDALIKSSTDKEKAQQTFLTQKQIRLREKLAERRRIAEAKRPRPLRDLFSEKDSRYKKERSEFEAKASEWMAVANEGCPACEGYGLRFIPRRNYPVCNCVYRAVFRKVLAKYRFADLDARNIIVVSSHGINNSFPGKEYRADFELSCNRILHDEPLLWYVWRFHILERIPWRPCIAQISSILKQNIDRGQFFHAVYRVETMCGKMLVNLRPYPLFPIDAYFSYTAMENLMVIRTMRSSKKAN